MQINLNKDEVLVLFEFLSNVIDTQDDGKTLDDGTIQAIDNLICEFEAELVEPMQPNYENLLEAAKTRLASFKTGRK